MGSIVKKIKKTVGKVTGGLLGIDQKAPSAAAQVEAPAPAVEVETAKVDNVDTGDASTESNQKRARSAGKRALSVTRNSGGGVNI